MSVATARRAWWLVAAVALTGACGPGVETETEHAGSAVREALPAPTAVATTPGMEMSPGMEMPPGVAEELEEKWGVRLDSLRTSVAGYAIDFRYWVVDAEKATPLLQRKLSRDPQIIVEKSGAVLHVPRSRKIGAIRQSVRVASQIKEGSRYFVVFANPGRHVEPGDKVTIVIGDFRVENVTVL